MNIIFRTMLLGIIAGMRSMSAPAFTSRFLSRQAASNAKHTPNDKTSLPLRLLQDKRTVLLTTTLAIGELLADKLPFIPNRTDPGPLLGRAASGALVGAALAQHNGRAVFPLALLGSGGAILSAFTFFNLRHKAVVQLHVPDPLLGVAEDLLVISGGLCAIQKSVRGD